MSDNFIVFFLLSLLYCVAILCLTYFFIYKKIKIQIQSVATFGAGVLCVMVLFEFLPHSFSAEKNIYKNIIFVLCGFLVNAFAEIGLLPYTKFLNRLLPLKKHDCHQHDSEHTHYHLLPVSVGCSAVGCFILCAFFDGIRLASSLLINMETAIMMSIGLLFHLLPESVAVLGIGLSSGFSRRFLFGIITFFCLAFLGGYYMSFLVSYVNTLQNFILPFASGLFLYVCIVHFIPMIIKFKIKKWFFIGMTLGLILSQIAHFLIQH